MAGKRQHYVPRLLQRGFLHDRSGNVERTWLHRRVANAQLVSIRDVGVENWFYSRKALDGSPTLDDLITDLESDLAQDINALRACELGTSIDGRKAARTVVHLVLRTAHLRQIFSAGTAHVLEKVEWLFSDPTRVRAMIGLDGLSPSPIASDAIRIAAAKVAEIGVPHAFSERFFLQVLREFGDDLLDRLTPDLGPIFQEVTTGLSGKIRDSHNAALLGGTEDNVWLEELSTFDWAVEAGSDLILPDTVALAREDDRALKPLLFTKAAACGVVVMPIATDRALIGRRKSRPPIDLESFNAQAAASCDAFFIGATSLDDDNLTRLIGTWLKNEIEEAVAESVNDAGRSWSSAGRGTRSVRPESITSQDFSFSVRIQGSDDELLAKEYADILRSVVGVLSQELPLHELDGITIATDYDGALAELDRGDPELPPITSSALSYGQAVAKSVPVIREGLRKEHLVIDAGLAQTWLSSDAQVRATGLHTLVKRLAAIAHSTRYAAALQSTFDPDVMERELHAAVASTPSGYWSARQAAFVDPDQGQAYARLVIDSLDFAEQEIAAARADIPESGDITDVMMCALQCVSATLGHAANWLGHRDWLAEDQAFAGDDLPEKMAARGLERWIELFGRDLASVYSQDDRFNLDIATGLSPHVERLLWTFGIYCWPQDDAMRCLVTDQSFFPSQPPI